MVATSAASAGRSSAAGQSVRWTEPWPASPVKISSVTMGSSGAATRHTTCSAVKSVSNASVASWPAPAVPAQKRSRLRRMYQLVSVSRNVRSVPAAPNRS